MVTADRYTSSMDFSKRLSDEAEVRVTMPAQSHEGPHAALLRIAQVDGTHPHRREGLLKVARPEDAVPADGRIVRTDGDLDGSRALLVQGADWIMRISTGSGLATVELVAATSEAADRLVESLRPHRPAATTGEDRISIGFWRYQAAMARPIRTVNDVLAPRWAEIAGNYARSTADAFGDLVRRGPGSHSRLLLLHGPPGTGKTTAIRALAREWRDDCATSVVVDPERLFNDADYLHQLLTAPSQFFADREASSMTLLVIEDADELISRQARDRTGQALSRLLNLTDGLIGQVHPTLVCITTNEPLAELHPAVRRPGRCLADIEVPKLSRAEAAAWLGDGVDAPPAGASLAELLVLREEMGEPVTGSPLVTPAALGYL